MPVSATYAQPGSRKRFDASLGLSLVLLLAPVAAFHLILWRNSANIPELDDYDAVLDFLIGWIHSHGIAASLRYFFAAQHVQYKLYFQQLIYIAEYALTGHINFRFLQQLGNCFVLASAAVLWCMFRAQPAARLSSRLFLFAPAAYVLFALQYSEVLNWAMSALQNVAILFFSLGCFYFLGERTRGSFLAALVFLVVAISTSGNGFFAALSGLLFLLQQRFTRRAVAWTATTLLLAVIYSYHYHQVSMPPTVTQHVVMLYTLFPVAFLGAAAGSVSIKAGLLTGFLLLAAGTYLMTQRWRLLDPVTFYAVVFILMTTLGVTMTRHMFGLGSVGAMASRYRVYSQLLAALIYLAALNLGVGSQFSIRRRRVTVAACIVFPALFCVSSDRLHLILMQRRMYLVRQHYAEWVRSPESVSLIPDEELYTRTPEMIAFRRKAAVWTTEAIAMGLYRPPTQSELGPR